jgi:hypothetical protein
MGVPDCVYGRWEEELFKYDGEMNMLLSYWQYESIYDHWPLLQSHEMNQGAIGSHRLLISKSNHTGVVAIYTPLHISAI